MTEAKYSRCPDCGGKTVYFKMRANGEDGYTCRKASCAFEFFTLGNSRIDRMNEERWKQANEKLTAQRLFAWAVALDDAPTIEQAMAHFHCTQRDVEDAVDAADNDERIPGGYLGLAVALAIGSGSYELRGKRRLVEAYYAPDAKEAKA